MSRRAEKITSTNFFVLCESRQVLALTCMYPGTGTQVPASNETHAICFLKKEVWHFLKGSKLYVPHRHYEDGDDDNDDDDLINGRLHVQSTYIVARTQVSTYNKILACVVLSNFSLV